MKTAAALILVAALLGGAGYWVWTHQDTLFPKGVKPAVQPVVSRFTGAPAEEEASLFFCDPMGGFLTPEKRLVPKPGDPAEFGKNLIAALAEGPKQRAARSVPEGVRVLGLAIGAKGAAYLDLSREVTGLPGGIEAEYLTLYSMVNTLCANVPEIESVRILVEGAEIPTLGGHLDTRFPYAANMTIVR
jgi:hypothetical protein